MTENSDIQKMLRAVINQLSAFRVEVSEKFDKLGNELRGKIDNTEKRLTKRLDKIGRQLAYLEDDAPTREEFENPPILIQQINI
jgi:hypothetical protein